MNLNLFKTAPFTVALKSFFEGLNVPVNYIADEPAKPKDILGDKYHTNNHAQTLIDEVYLFGIINDDIFEGRQKKISQDEIQNFGKDYDGVVILGITLKRESPTRTQLAEITRAFNSAFPYTPVTIVFKYGHCIAFANSERLKYKQTGHEGEKMGKVTLLKDVSINSPHAAHKRILSQLAIDQGRIYTFEKLYHYWQSVFSLQELNKQFYADLQEWFYYASHHIKLPYHPDYISEKENIKNFLVRLLSRTMFCWFVKEKGLIQPELLELKDWEGNLYPLTCDIDDTKFLKSNSYYRGVLQNIFFRSLNQKDKKSKRDFEGTRYLHPAFDYKNFIDIPYLNGGIFDELEEDNARDSNEDTVIKIPNFLFYGIEEKEKVTRGRGANVQVISETVEHKGLNGIFNSYKFTLEENTPYEEDIALDPELLGLVFENLLAELDPNLEESAIKSIRKQTGSYYTPRKVIQTMVNESLFLYLKKQIKPAQISTLKKLIYENKLEDADNDFCNAIVKAIDEFRMLDPACGSGAFPMVMLHRLVEILKMTDPDNSKWLRLKLKPVDPHYRAEFEKTLKSHLDDYSRKLGIIRDSIYGIDIQPLAVQITKLRFFISLLIDQKIEKGITPMPNIETKIICADSLKNIKATGDMFVQDAINKLEKARIKYYQPDLSHKEREKVTEEIVDLLDVAFPSFAKQVTGKDIKGQNKNLIRHWFTHAQIAAPFFNMDFFYPELKDRGFDCVLGNPPYGGTKVTDEVRTTLGIESKDPYGAFISRFLGNGIRNTPLRHGGVLAFIVSDTFMTIKSHYKLRCQMMDNYIHKMIRVHPDTFGATVNTAIIICERNVFPKDSKGKILPAFNERHICQMADMTNVSAHENYSRFIEILHQTEGVDFSDEKKLPPQVSTPEYAIYYYPQQLIKTNSNLPFFVASSKLFALMNDSKEIESEAKKIGNRDVRMRKIPMNGKVIEVVKLGEIADVKVGLQTGDNDAYLFQNPEARGNYRSIEDYKEFLLTEKDLDRIRNEEKLRMEVIEKGISKGNKNSKRYFEGRYIIPYDKGGESDAEGGWMPNYYVKINYFIDWSEWAIKRMKTLTTKERNKNVGKDEGNEKLCSRFQNSDSYFTPSISFSRTGVYSPTFRIGTSSAFDTEGSMIFQDYFAMPNLSGVLSSKMTRYLAKAFIGHTVHAQIDELKELVLSIVRDEKSNKLVKAIIQKQKQNPRYDYASNEQIEIDRLVYEAYGLNEEDIQGVETWYKRRYPKLAAAQEENLRKLKENI